MLVIGLMSGTSADGIDVALARVEEEFPVDSFRLTVSEKRNPRQTLKNRQRSTRRKDADANKSEVRRELVGHATVAMDAAVRKEVLRIAEGGASTAGEISQLNFRVGEEFAAAATAACKKWRVPMKSVGLIGSHGQTIFHQGAAVEFLGRKMTSTLQIGEPAVIAARTGVTTVGDFRVADMAAGGQGAPLVPYVDWLLLRDERVGRVALNLGGIGNVTVLGPEEEEKSSHRGPRARTRGTRRSVSRQDAGATKVPKVMAFDTGPGNMVIDALVGHFTNGRQRFDRDAAMARRGRCFNSLLKELLRDPYLEIAPPKSTGREYYGRESVARLLEKARKYRMRPEDVVRTATVFTALSVVDALNRFVLPRVKIDEMIVSGGGAKNPLIMAQLAAGLAPIEVMPLSRLGIAEDAKEAYAFALLAYETWRGRTGNLPSATGAKKAVVLGKICRV
jgi:anhydro-N-acetylmuramic acid kinase